jgi:hypothetical protein
MSLMDRPGRLTLTAMMMLAVYLVACQAAPSGGAGSGGPSSTSAASIGPSATPKPISMPRPTDIPTDGTCAQYQTCLGLLTPGTVYTTTNFLTPVSFSVPDTGWENRSDEQGDFQLLPIAAPGDIITFFVDPRASGPGASTVGSTVEDLAAWLVANPLLQVTPPQSVTVGGATGVSMDIRIAAGAENQDPSCPVQVCVPFMEGHDITPPIEWNWDWGSNGTETQRLFLVTTTDGAVVALFVDSLDGSTFDAITAQAEAILQTLKFG